MKRDSPGSTLSGDKISRSVFDMSRRSTKNGRNQTIFSVAIVVMLAIGLGYLTSGGTWWGLFGTTTPIGPAVNVSPQFYLFEDGGAHAALNGVNVNIYDADGDFVQSATSAATGLVTLATMQSGKVIKIQARQAAPATADPYVTPVLTRTVPAGSSGDTVTMLPVYAWDVTGTDPTLAVSDQAFGVVADTTNYYFNATDTQAIIRYSAIDADTAWGFEPFTDLVTGRSYGGPVLVWKTNTSQAWLTAPDFTVSDPDFSYYIWHIDRLIDNSNIDTDDSVTVTLIPVTAFTTGQLVEINIFAGYEVSSTGQFLIGNLMNGASGIVNDIDTIVL
jgi:hypothetical protein